MYKLWSQKINKKIFLTIAVLSVATAALFFSAEYRTADAQVKGDDMSTPQSITTVFSNTSPIVPADRVSNNAGTNPGIPPANYPSPIVVAGLTGTVSKVTVTFALTTTFPDDVDIVLVNPSGVTSLVMSDAAGSGDITNVSFTFDQTAASPLPDGGTTPQPAGTFQPSNYLGLATPEPGGQDNFPTPGGGLSNYPTGFNVFNGTNPNGTWNLFVVDDQVIDTLSLPSGWSIDITTNVAPPAQHVVDMNGDGRSDFVVVRNTGGGASGQLTWFINLNNSTTSYGSAWGLASDFRIAEDFDGDNKTDISVWRPVSTGQPSGNAFFYILQSATSTVRIDDFGQIGDDPTVIGDYDGDGKADPAVYRGGASSGLPSTWYFRGSLTPANITGVQWGQNGDFPAPGDYDGDGKNDFVIQRNNGGGRAKFWMLQTTAGFQNIVFGTPTDIIVPGDYDGDGKTDIATVRGSAGQINWYVRPSSTGAENNAPAIFGASATDLVCQGDYDGDGKTDVAIWRPSATPGASAFWVLGSTGSTFAVPYGQNGDYAVANYNSH